MEARDYVTLSGESVDLPLSEPLVVEMRRGGRLGGLVRDPQGRGLGGVDVYEVPEGAKTLHDGAVQTTALITRHLESVVRKHPEAWGWWLKRWRIRPDDTKDHYPSYSVRVSRFTSKKRDY